MNRDYLKNVKKIVVHENGPGNPCPDGTASALILKDVLPDAEIVFCSYGPAQQALVPPSTGPYGSVLFCDFTPFVEREKTPPHAITDRGLLQAKAWVDAGAIVLDHHAGTADLVALFGDRGVFADRPGVSGATLAFEEVWVQLAHASGNEARAIAEFAHLVGVRDTWQRDSRDWDRANRLSAALAFFPWVDLVHTRWCDLLGKLHEVGTVLVAKQREADRRTAAEAYHFFAGCLRVACFEGGSREASDVRDLLGHEVDLVLAWHYYVVHEVQPPQPVMKVSARSNGKEIDCSVLAKVYGGNGHKGAAGFTIVPHGKLVSDPYTVLRAVVQAFVSGS